jgi:serine/threonine protein kinase
MAATLSTDQFLDVLRKSKLLDEKQLQGFLESSSTTLPAASRELAQQMIRHGLLTHFQAMQLMLGKWKGFLLAGGKYRLLEKLGAGGMGQVVLCEHVRMKRLVALKVLPTDRLKDDQSALERFDREARASAALDHPNIVRAHDMDTDGKLHFLVMEFVDGSSLQDIVKKHGPFEIHRACNYIAQAAEGLQHAHEAGWVHRDIKPGNLLVDRAGTVKILDMGLARLFTDDSDNLTRKYEKNAVLGTADYLAPEQATNSSDVDIRADIYSLGATFYFLLTGRGPFDQGTVTQKLIWHQTKPPDSIRSLRPDVPKELEAVINKMMAKKPVHRYQEPAAIVEALRPWTQHRIEPPAEEEMPRLCPALANYTTVGSSAPLSGLSGPPSTIRSRGRSGPRSTSVSRKSLPRIAVAELPGWVKWASVGGGALAILALGIGIAYWLTRPEKPEPVARTGDAGTVPITSPPSVTPPDRAKDKAKTQPPVAPGDIPAPSGGQWYVARGGRAGRADVLGTLAEAVAKAAAGDTIRVLIPDIEEQVTVSAKQAGVHIESGLSGPVLWRAPADAAADRPLLRLESAGAALVKGFEFDGGKRVRTLVHVGGTCGGLRLEDCYLTDAQDTALVLADAAAPGGNPIQVDRVRFTTLRDYTVPANHGKAAIRPAALHATGGSAVEPLRLSVRWCRFEGMYRAAVLLDGPVDGDIRLNRFYSLRNDERPPEAAAIDALSVKTPAAGPVKLTLASNTMSRFTNLLHLDKLPPVDGGSKFVLRSNLLMGTQGDAFVLVRSRPSDAAAKRLFDGSAGNVCRPNTVAKGLGGDVVPRKTVQFGYIDVALGSDGFLRYKKTGETAALLTAGAGGEPVGVPPLD